MKIYPAFDFLTEDSHTKLIRIDVWTEETQKNVQDLKV